MSEVFSQPSPPTTSRNFFARQGGRGVQGPDHAAEQPVRLQLAVVAVEGQEVVEVERGLRLLDGVSGARRVGTSPLRSAPFGVTA